MSGKKIPSEVYLLGRAIELDSVKYSNKWTKKDNYILTTNATGKKLLIFKAPKKKIKVSDSYLVEDNIYEMFHGRLPNTAGLARLKKDPDKIIDRALFIVYESNKRSRKKHHYIHHFETPPLVKADRWNNPTVILITGGNIQVTDRGIEG